MLYSIDSGKYVTQVPHKKDFDRWMKNLSAADYQSIADTLIEKIEESDINTIKNPFIFRKILSYGSIFFFYFHSSRNLALCFPLGS